jgi:hypothetical protein
MRICVFCGSRAGNIPAYSDAAREVGIMLAERGIELVYGGGHVGLMGVTADAVLSAGGVVHGVIPRALAEKELAHDGVTELYLTESMHERKMKMDELSDAFLALPGGVGTMEEIFEQWTWGQLDIHSKPCAFLNVAGYYDPLRSMIGTMVESGFLSDDHSDMVRFARSADEALAHFESYAPPEAKWVQLTERPKA